MSAAIRKGAVEISPATIPEGPITLDTLRRVAAPTARIAEGAVGDKEMSDVGFDKITGGTLSGEKEMIMAGEDVILKSSNYLKDERHFVVPLISNLSKVISCDDANFTGADVGRPIAAEGLDPACTIASVTSATQATLSHFPGAPAVTVPMYMSTRPAGAGWALFGNGVFEINAGAVFRGQLAIAGFTADPNGTVTIGAGDSKMTALPDGSFTWGSGGAVVGVTPDGELFAGGEDKDTAIFLVDRAGNVTVKETSQSVHSIPASSLDWTILPPTFDPPGGAFDATVDVAILCQTPNVTIYYTTDGSTPDSGDTLYTGARIHLSATTTLKAIAYLVPAVGSTVSSQTFTNDNTVVPNPAADPVDGTYSPIGGVLEVELTADLAGASIRYTLDGTTPSDVDGILIEPISPATVPVGTIELPVGTTTLKIIAFITGKTNSGVVTYVYVVTNGGGGGGGGPGGGGRGNVP